MKRIVLHWFRRDLRLFDNTALRHAVKAGDEIVPVYIVSDWSHPHHWTGSHRQQFLCDSLKVLDENLRAKGGRLILRRGAALDELGKLAAETKAAAIYFNRDPDPHGRKVEEQLTRWGNAHGVQIMGYQDHCLHERDEVLNSSGTPYRVFTPYARAWAKLSKQSSSRLPTMRFKEGVSSGLLPTLKTWNLPPAGCLPAGGETAAKKRMRAFLGKGVRQYGERRNAMEADGTSRLSQDLRFGLISIRDLHEQCQAAMIHAPAGERRNVEIYVGELIWREFFMQILWHFPEVLEVEFNPRFRGLGWSRDNEAFQRWCEGQIGFPIVDAGMRQLNQTGFMHNRARMITAMFLTKDLRLDWRLGERYFMTRLVDGEIASNNGGWQWSAGTGADAAPYFRIQNPWTQARRFDPRGEYIKRWVPELRNVPPELLWREPSRPLAKGYPAPIVNHGQARAETLEFFSSYRRTAC